MSNTLYTKIVDEAREQHAPFWYAQFYPALTALSYALNSGGNRSVGVLTGVDKTPPVWTGSELTIHQLWSLRESYIAYCRRAACTPSTGESGLTQLLSRDPTHLCGYQSRWGPTGLEAAVNAALMGSEGRLQLDRGDEAAEPFMPLHRCLASAPLQAQFFSDYLDAKIPMAGVPAVWRAEVIKSFPPRDSLVLPFLYGLLVLLFVRTISSVSEFNAVMTASNDVLDALGFPSRAQIGNKLKRPITIGVLNTCLQKPL